MANCNKLPEATHFPWRSQHVTKSTCGEVEGLVPDAERVTKVGQQVSLNLDTVTGWWFGTFFHRLGIITPTDELIFSEGYVYHQPGYHL